MKKSIRFALAALVLTAASGGAQAGVITNWGNIAAPGATFSLYNSFSSATTFSDDYLFSLSSGTGNAIGEVDTFDGFLNFLNVELSSVKLFKDGNLFGTDANPSARFSFNGLTAGNYALQVSGKVTNSLGLFPSKVGYDGEVKINVSAPSCVSAGAHHVCTAGRRPRGAGLHAETQASGTLIRSKQKLAKTVYQARTPALRRGSFCARDSPADAATTRGSSRRPCRSTRRRAE